MTWAIFLGISALVAFVIGIMTPIVKLNSTITKLDCTIDALSGRFNETNRVTTKRLDAHGKEIDELREQGSRHEQELKNIKEKVEFFHHN